MNNTRYIELVKHEDTIIDIMLTSTELSNSAVTTPSPLSLKLTPNLLHNIGGRLLHLSIVIVSFLSPKGGSLRKMAPKVGILRGARKSPVTDMSLLGV